jgi:hypothetical protein
VSTARAQWMNASWSLKNMLYTNPSSVYDTVKGVKLQMKAIFGYRSEPRHAMTKFQVIKPKTL